MEGGEETPASASSSPKNRVKFLCSHGGKILPRPPDGQLKYVSGETRVVAVPRDINFSDLMKKLSSLSDGEVILKYQVIPEDLETLVSVTSDEDLQNMLSEHDRQDMKSPESNGSPKLRTFLFPSHPTIVEGQISPNTRGIHVLEQRYVDAINGILRPPVKLGPISLRRATSNGGRPIFSISSAGSSPKAMPHDCYNVDTISQDSLLVNANQNWFPKEIPRVSSSPSLYNLSNQNPYNLPPQQAYYPSSRLHGQGNSGSGRLSSALSMGPNDYGRCQGGPPLPRYCLSSRPPSRGSAECSGCGHVDGCRVYRSGGGVEMVVGFPQSSMGT